MFVAGAEILLPMPQSGFATWSFWCHAQPVLAHMHAVELAVEKASGGQLVQVSAAPVAISPPTVLAKVFALHAHVVWPATEEAPVVHCTHCSAPVLTSLTA